MSLKSATRSILAIDPGFKGGIAQYTRNDIWMALPMPTIKVGKKSEYDVALIREWMSDSDWIVVEKQRAFPGQGVTSMFSLGRAMGLFEGLAIGLGKPLELVEPKKWQREFSITGTDKSKSIATVQRLVPHLDLTPGRRTKPHDGMADAVLIGMWCQRTQG